MLGTYPGATGGNMEESGTNIIDGNPIKTNNIYVGLAQKSFAFASAADSSLWATLQGSPKCLVYDPDDDTITSVDCTVTVNGVNAVINANFNPRVNTQGATSISRTYFFRFVDITCDIGDQGVSIYH